MVRLASRNAVIASSLLGLVIFGAGWMQQPKEKKAMPEPVSVRFINRSPVGYSNVVEVRGGRTLYIAGQVALDQNGKLVGPGDMRAQAKQVFENLKLRLAEGRASFKDVVKLNYYITDGSEIQALRDIRDNYVNTENPPASTLVVVKGLARAEYMVEVEAIAVAGD